MLYNSTNQIVLVSFKNIHIWPKNGVPIFGHTCFGHNSAEFFVGAQETFFYRLVINNDSL